MTALSKYEDRSNSVVCCWISSGPVRSLVARKQRSTPALCVQRMEEGNEVPNRISSSIATAFPSRSPQASSASPTLHMCTDPSVIFSNFDEVLLPCHVKVKGQLPYYLHDKTYYRVGAGRFTDEHADGTPWRAVHFFDALSMLSSFRFDVLENSVIFQSRMNSPRLLKKIRSTPAWIYRNLQVAAVRIPIWKMLLNWRPPAMDWQIGLPYTNYVVNLEWIPGRGLCSRTDVPTAQPICAKTLQPLKQFHFSELHPKLNGLASMTHGMTDSKTGEYFNVVWSYLFGKTDYQVFCTKQNGETNILATFRDHPCYMHSASFTDNYIILTLSPIRMRLVQLLISFSIGNSIKIATEKDVKFVVICRKKGAVVATYSHEAFTAFHSISAFEEGNDIILDWCCSINAKDLMCFDMEEVKKKAPLPNASVRRFILPDVKNTELRERSATLQRARSKVILAEAGEFPIVARTNGDYRYLYTTKNEQGVASGLLQKFDIKTGECRTFGIPRCLLGEVAFVKDPDGSIEDQGCLVLVALDTETKCSMVLVLDAREFVEVARAELDVGVPYGFHGYITDSVHD